MTRITFSFGRNWNQFVDQLDDQSIEAAKKDISDWMSEGVVGKTVLDIGCGSGIHSYSFWKLGAAKVVSFDYDEFSVEATMKLWERAGKPENWTVSRGSVLDKNFLNSLGKFDVLYSWGVLHHTGSMWQAIENAMMPVNPDGVIWIALYQGVETYQYDLKLKTLYNNANWFGKKWMVAREIIKIMKRRRRKGLNPFGWNIRRGRGMSTYYDIIDWLGGLPYEVASRKEVEEFLDAKGQWHLKKYNDTQACFVYLFTHEPKSNPQFVEYPY
jgi:SAM-dependent methyltransferase